jgi:hypothetical protein
MADVLRVVTVILAVFAASQFPGILARRVPGWRSWVVVVAVEVLLFSAIARVLDHLTEPIVWYGTPALLIASLLVLFYALSGSDAWARRYGRR